MYDIQANNLLVEYFIFEFDIKYKHRCLLVNRIAVQDAHD